MNLNLGDRPWMTLKLYAILLNSQGRDKRDIQRTLEDFVLRCDPHASRKQWESTIEWAVGQRNSRPLRCVDSIGITQKELDAVACEDGQTKRKVLFTLICLAKYRNIVNSQNNGWVNYDIPDIFKLANVNLSQNRQTLIINKLYTDGAIRLSRLAANTGMQVVAVDMDGDAVMTISDFRNLGNQYMKTLSDEFIECEECGLVIRRSKNGKRRLCNQCAKQMNREKSLDRYYRKRAF